MAGTGETVKKAKAPARPRATGAGTKTATAGKVTAGKATAKKAAAKRQTVAEKLTATTPTHEEIARLAQQYWAERGWQDGQAEQDWLRAEQELMKMAS